METRELHWIEMMKYYGLKEIKGSNHNPIILSWFEELGHPGIKDDETAWCALSVNITAKRCGLEYSTKLDARSFLKLGIEVETPKTGHLVVYYRNGLLGWQGHVGLFAGWSEDRTGIWTLSGNQNNEICIWKYPVIAPTFGLLGFRELKKANIY